MKKTLFFLTLFSIFFAACSSHTEYVGVNLIKVMKNDYQEVKVVDEDVNLWLGVIQNPKYSKSMIKEKCPSGMGSITKEKWFTASLIQICTLGIYTTMHVDITCMKDKQVAFDMELSPEDVRRLVTDERFLKIVKRSNPEMLAEAEYAQNLVKNEMMVCIAD